MKNMNFIHCMYKMQIFKVLLNKSITLQYIDKSSLYLNVWHSEDNVESMIYILL